MKDWLLKEEKNKVGRPKLANEKIVKKAKILIAFCFFICFLLAFCFASIIKGVSPMSFAYELTFQKLVGASSNPNGFLAKTYYDDNHDYVMEIKITDAVDRYSGNYRYTTYYLDGNDWVEKESKSFDKGEKLIKIKIDSIKNENVTWKVKFQIVNGAEIKDSYAPRNWKFVDANKNADKYAYQVFTVKGYYSPVTVKEIDEGTNASGKITISTEKGKPRWFNVNLPAGNYNVIAKYTDVSGKEVLLAKDENVNTKVSYKVPNTERSTKVSFMVCNVTGSDLSNNVLSNWKVKEDKKLGSCATNNYVLKPEKSYEN